MPDLSSLLTRDRDDGARVLALLALARVSRALSRVSAHPERVQPLYRARVRLRRFRATLALYNSALDGTLRPRDRRRLRTLHRRFGRARDLDARIAWLDELRPALPALAAKEAAWLASVLRTQRATEAPELVAAIRRHFRPFVKRWTRALRHYSLPRVAGHPVPTQSPAQSLARCMATELERHTTLVVTGLEHAERHATRTELHQLRRRIKRLRALLQPWRRMLPASAPLYAMLSGAQTQLGIMRDAELLADVARANRRRRRGRLVPLHALADALDQVAAEAEAQFALDWFTRGGARLLEASAAVTVALMATEVAPVAPVAPVALPAATGARPQAPTGTATEPPTTPLPLEIERKYLLRAVPPEAREAPSVRIAQGWLPGLVLRERLRRTVHPDGGVEWTRTVKAGTGVARVELEEPASAMLFESLWPFTSAARVEKVRHTVPDGTVRWEIDIFLDRELVLAEVELLTAETEVTFPDWLAPYVVREVTGDADYVNANLARDIRRSSTP